MGLAKASGIETPTREELARFDRKRKKRMSNQEWKSPSDDDARITKMKDGRTHLAHKTEHAVDLDTGAVVAVTLQGADLGDTTTLDQTLSEAGMAVADLVELEAELRPEEPPKVNVEGSKRWYGQGLPQRRGRKAHAELRSKYLHSGKAKIRKPSLGRQS